MFAGITVHTHNSLLHLPSCPQLQHACLASLQLQQACLASLQLQRGPLVGRPPQPLAEGQHRRPLPQNVFGQLQQGAPVSRPCRRTDSRPCLWPSSSPSLQPGSSCYFWPSSGLCLRTGSGPRLWTGRRRLWSNGKLPSSGLSVWPGCNCIWAGRAGRSCVWAGGASGTCILEQRPLLTRVLLQPLDRAELQPSDRGAPAFGQGGGLGQQAPAFGQASAFGQQAAPAFGQQQAPPGGLAASLLQEAGGDAPARG